MNRTIGRRIGTLLIAVSLLFGTQLLNAVPGAHAAVEGDFIYEDIGGGHARITGYGGAGGMVVIPGQLGGMTVTVIGDSAFRGKGLTGVALPDSLTTIKMDAFRSNHLTELKLPDSVTTIEEQAFQSNQIADLTLPDGITTIGVKAFKYNQLETLVLPDSITMIEEGAFESNQLSKIKLPRSLTSIGVEAFRDNKLVELTIPDNITTIEWNAFLGNPTLTQLTISDGVTTIGANAFNGAGLTRLIIPGSVNVIDPFAFANNPLQEVVILNPDIDLNGNDVFDMHPPGMGLYGTVGSNVQTYAANNGIPFHALTGGLAKLKLDIPGLRFDPLERTFHLLTNAHFVTVTAAPIIPSSEIQVNHVTVPEGMSSAPVSLTEGTQTITVDVTAPDDSMEQYLIVLAVDHTAPSISLSASPAGSTHGPVTVTADVYGAAADSVKWADGARTAVYFADGGTPFTGDFTVSANGTYTVYARDEAGNEAVNTIAVTNIGTSTTPSGPGPVVQEEPKQDPEPKTEAWIDKGVIIVKVAPRDINEAKQPDGRVTDQAVLPPEIIDQLPKLLDQAERPFVRVVIDDRHPEVQLQLPAGPLREWMSDHPELAFEARLNGSSFQLEVNVLDLQQLAARLGVDVKDLQVGIVIKTVAGPDLEALVQTAQEQNLKLLGQAVEFRLIVAGGGQTLEISDFGGTYLLKSIVLDEDVLQRNYTAVLYDPTARSFAYVPAVSARLSDGRAESVMRMPHNSIYAIMEAVPVRFADMTAHWAKPEVEYMASKRIISGVSPTTYAPDRAITRAEFTALLVRALGIRTEAMPAGDRFADVPANAWYASVVEAGARAGLVSGVSDARFAPEQPVTREQIAVMLANARQLATDGTAAAQSAQALTRYADAAQISPWAVDAFAEAVADGIIQGMTADLLAPSDTATRAQAAVMLARTLRAIGFLE